MTVEDARSLKKGDRVRARYRDEIWKVLNTKERRSAKTNEVYIEIKLGRGNSTWWVFNEFVERI